MSRVTVLLPVHNGARHVDAAITSVLAQTYDDFTLLVIDDGSTDDTADIVSGFQDPRVQLERQARHGLTTTLMKGFQLAYTEMIARQDADDISRPDRLMKQIALLEAERDVALVGCSVDVINDEDGIVARYDYPPEHEKIVALLHSLITPLPHTTLLFRRKEIAALGGYRAQFVKAQDFDLLLRVSEKHRLASLSDRLCEVRYSDASVGANNLTGSQFKYAVLALACSYARQLRGEDPLAGPHAELFLKEFDEWFAGSDYPRRGTSRHLRRQARVAISRGEYLDGLRQLVTAICRDPEWLLWVSRIHRKNIGLQAREWVMNA